MYSIQGVLLVPFVSVGLALFLLGFYVILFGSVATILYVRQPNEQKKLHLYWMTTLFILSVSSAALRAGQIINDAVLGFQVAITQDSRPLHDWVSHVPHKMLEVVSAALYILANCVADTLLLYRCFILWEDSSKRIFIVASVVSILTNATGFVALVVYSIGVFRAKKHLTVNGSYIGSVYVIINAINTLTLSIIIVGRIWWSSREPREIMGRGVNRRYRQAIAMIVESGFLYSATLIVDVAFKQSVSTLGFGLDLFPLVALMVGIAPTLIILRSSLGLSRSGIPDSRIFSALRFGEQLSTDEAGQNPEVRAVDLQSESVDECSELRVHKPECNGTTSGETELLDEPK
ncbi:hypothetical protein Moror_9629 [Moniliophthora roreri MCA 2997]|uniref:Uncharacterized protein n=1 Tax=Moniliophthora roreri (strain MCA 2997) TaxID=1381753 RepID=V2WJT2_MONRO|nr:hypothetical protein Moror_9629 [Moniliophthora roreri MCA 2997]